MQRRLVAIVLLALGLGALWYATSEAPSGGAEAHVDVMLPDGTVLANGTYGGATALDVLLTAARQEGFFVDVEEGAGFSGCARHYVVAIGGVRESPQGGWIFEINNGSGWTLPVQGAGCVPADGSIRWRWTDEPAV